MQHYLGPDRPLTTLSSWDEVVTAAEGGLLRENRWCELKTTLPPSNRKTNTELACDLAALAVYGGAFIVGVNDDEQVVGTDIDGMVTRISQVAATRIEPPLSPVIHDPIEGPDGKFVLIVAVPPSPVRPHMVDDVYWGRSSDGKRPLGDAEVRSLMLEGASSEEDFRARLLRTVNRDPLINLVEDGPSGHGHIYLLAEPCAPMPRVPDDLDVRNMANNLPSARPNWEGHLGNCTQRGYDPEGRSFMTRREALPSRYERNLCFFSIKDRDASIEVVSGGGTATGEHPRGVEVESVLGGLATTLAYQTFELVRELSKAVGYMGQWRVGVHITNLRGKTLNTSNFGVHLPAFVADTYTQTRLTSVSALDEVEPEVIALMRGFHRGLGVESWQLQSIMSGL